MRIAIVFVILLVSICGLGQNDSIKRFKLDSLALKLRDDSARIYRWNVLRPYANIDNRNSYIRHVPVYIQGGQVGVIVNEYHIFGLGFYTIIQKTERAAKVRENSQLVNRYLNLTYYTSFYQYVLLDKRFLEIDLPFEAGYGKYNLRFQDGSTDMVFRSFSGPIVPLGAGVQVVLKPVRWIGASFTGGYRYVFSDNKTLNLNGLYYSFGLWLDIRQVYRDCRFYFVKKKKYKKAVQQVMQG